MEAKRPLHIAIDASWVRPSHHRGYLRLVLLLLRSLAQSREPHDYLILSSDASMKDCLPKDPRFHLGHPRRYIPMRHRQGLGAIGKFLIRGLDLVHFPCHDIWFDHRGKSIVNIHDLAPVRFPERFFKNQEEEEKYHLLLKKISEHATLVLTGSNFSRQDILKHLPIEPERIRTIYPSNDPVFLSESQPLSPDEMKHLGIEAPYFLFVGQMTFRKNIPLLLKAYSLYRERGGKANLVLVGEQDPANPTYFPPLKPLLDGMKERQSVFWLRNIPDPLLARIYTGSRALVNCSIFEGFGSPLIEAMACGTPVIAARCTSFPEVAGEAALLVEPEEEKVAQAMIEMDLNEALRKRLIDLGRKRAGDFLPSKMAREMVQVYEDVALKVIK